MSELIYTAPIHHVWPILQPVIIQAILIILIAQVIPAIRILPIALDQPALPMFMAVRPVALQMPRMQVPRPLVAVLIPPVLISMPTINHVQLIQVIAKTVFSFGIVQEVSAKILIPTVQLTVIAAVDSAKIPREVALLIVIARAAIVIIPKLVALSAAPPATVLMVSVPLPIKAIVRQIAVKSR
jgi:hypothetical protein